MSNTVYDPREEYVGDGTVKVYDFNFRITDPTMVIFLVTDSLFNLTFRVDGTDRTFLSALTFDTINGGGTVTLVSNLALGSFLTILLAPDAPTQTAEFKNKADFTLRRFEAALDAISGQVQRLAYLASRSLKIGDSLQNAQPFNVSIPIVSTNPAVQSNVGKVVIVAPDNKSLTLGPVGAFMVPLQAPGVAPATPTKGLLVLNSAYILATYNGTNWVKTSDGSTLVTF